VPVAVGRAKSVVGGREPPEGRASRR
jgi:hypothetical protein